MLKKEAERITGGLSAPGKMPEGAYSIPAAACQTGQILAKVEGTPCSGCYALKNRYIMPIQKAAMERRLKSLDHESWTPAMATLIKGKKHFRWHDSGDIQSVKHLINIFEVCASTPDTAHWLPTQERKYLPLPGSSIPDNLVIRVSGSKIDGPRPTCWTHTSTVVTKGATCPAPSQGGKCKECRVCWTKSIKHVSYGKH